MHLNNHEYFDKNFIDFLRKENGEKKEYSLINYICQFFNDANAVEIKTINEHFFKPYIKTLIEKKVVHCSNGDFINIFVDSKTQVIETNR
jgi:hypothetical protein